MYGIGARRINATDLFNVRHLLHDGRTTRIPTARIGNAAFNILSNQTMRIRTSIFMLARIFIPGTHARMCRFIDNIPYGMYCWFQIFTQRFLDTILHINTLPFGCVSTISHLVQCNPMRKLSTQIGWLLIVHSPQCLDDPSGQQPEN